MITVQFDGVDRMVAELAKHGSQLNMKAMAALYTQSLRTLTKAIRYTPIDTGVLRGTGTVRRYLDAVEIVFGGAQATYAVYVHENLYVKHPIGQAKFLERAVMEDDKAYQKILVNVAVP